MRIQRQRHILATVGLAAALIGLVLGAEAVPVGATDELQAAEADWSAVESALGKSGQLMPGGVFRIGLPRSDLRVTVEGVPVQAGFALGSYAAFKLIEGGSDLAMVMGDLVLLDEEVPGVMSGLLERGLQVTALHNHALGDEPRLFYMHFWAVDEPLRLAGALRAVVNLTNSAPATGDTK